MLAVNKTGSWGFWLIFRIRILTYNIYLGIRTLEIIIISIQKRLFISVSYDE